MIRASLAGFAFVCAACGEPPEPAVASATTTAATTATARRPPVASATGERAADPELDARAIKNARREWQAIMLSLPSALESWGIGVDAGLSSDRATFQQHDPPCREKLEVLRRNFPDLSRFALSGDVERLGRDGACRVVYFAGGMKREVEFILDADGREVLFTWRVPEG